jgi:hypothetical protein
MSASRPPLQHIYSTHLFHFKRVERQIQEQHMVIDKGKNCIYNRPMGHITLGFGSRNWLKNGQNTQTFNKRGLILEIGINLP